jgi:hypothetical protein
MQIADSTGVASFTANPVLSGGTANGVTYLNGSKVLTTGSALTFDGSALGVAGRASLTGGGLTGSGNGMHLYFDTGSNTGFIKGFHAGVDDRAIRMDGLNLQFAVAGSEQMRLTSTGLGIGTSSPNARLAVVGGGIRVSGYSSNAPGDGVNVQLGTTGGVNYLQSLNGTGTNNLSIDANQVTFRTGSYATAATLDSSGNLGIGTSSPAYKLDVSGSARATDFKVGAASTELALFQFSGVSYLGNNYAANLVFRTNAADRLTLDSSGNLGLGVTPSATPGGVKSINVGSQGYVWGDGVEYKFNAGITNNAYVNGNNSFAAITSRNAAVFELNGDTFIWKQASTGTAGSTLSLTSAMTLDASGRLGIGNTSPTTTLSIGVSAGSGGYNGGVYLNRGSGSYNFYEASDGTNSIIFGLDNTVSVAKIGSVNSYPIGFFTGNAERARITSSGNMGIGTTDEYGRLNVQRFTSAPQSTLAIGDFATASNDVGIYLRTTGTAGISTAGGPIAFYRGGPGTTESARIDSSGNLLVGSTSAGLTNTNSVTLQTNGPGGVLVANHSGTASGSAYTFFAYNGSSIGGITQNGTTAVAYNTSSDYRLKNTIAPMTGALAKVALLKPCTYKWNADGSDGEGFIAHELQAVVPQCVTGEKDAVDAEGKPQYQGIDTSFLVATLTAAIQELKAEFDAYKASHP